MLGQMANESCVSSNITFSLHVAEGKIFREFFNSVDISLYYSGLTLSMMSSTSIWANFRQSNF